MRGPRHHDVLVIGGGNAGISLAAKLRRDGCRDVAIVEPRHVHQYRPMLSYVAGGMATLDELRRPQVEVIPKGCRWYPEQVVAVEPHRSAVAAGRRRRAHLHRPRASAPARRWTGTRSRAAEAAVQTPAASTSYLPELAVETWTMLSTLVAGTRGVRHLRPPRALRARRPQAPVPGGRPLAADRRARRDRRSSSWSRATDLVDLERADRDLRAIADDLGVRVRTATTVESVDAAGQVLRLRTPDGPDDLRYDALYLAPPHRAPQWVADSGLDHPRQRRVPAGRPPHPAAPRPPDVWGLGDVADVDALPSGGALRKQVPVVAHNIAARRTGDAMRHYDGYSIAPVTTSRTELMLAEFDRDGRSQPTVPVPDLVRPRKSLLLFDRYLEPQVYWHRLLRGKVS